MKQRQVKKILKKQGKLKQEPTVQEAWDALWLALNREPEWSSTSNCLFIGSSLIDNEAHGKLHSAHGLAVTSTVSISWEQHIKNLRLFK